MDYKRIDDLSGVEIMQFGKMKLVLTTIAVHAVANETNI